MRSEADTRLSHLSAYFLQRRRRKKKLSIQTALLTCGAGFFENYVRDVSIDFGYTSRALMVIYANAFLGIPLSLLTSALNKDFINFEVIC